MHTYRIGHAAASLGVGADTVRHLVDGGKLTVIKSTDVLVERPCPVRPGRT